MMDGKCGVVATFILPDGTRLRCQHDFGHEGDHSWKKIEKRYEVGGGITVEEVIRRAAEGSPAAQAIAATIKTNDDDAKKRESD
jgi:hypothetical protein